MHVVGTIFKCFLKPLKLDKFKNQNLQNFNIKVIVILEYHLDIFRFSNVLHTIVHLLGFKIRYQAFQSDFWFGSY
jgi:hypothetical protein